MTKEHQAIPCPDCNREKYFEGLCYWCKNRKERERYQAMTDKEVVSSITNIINKIETIKEWKDVYKDFCNLLAYKDIDTTEIAEAAFKKEIFYPHTIYRNVSVNVRDKLIEMLLQPDCEEASNILMCLALCGDDKVKDTFFKLEKNPLPWRKNLFVDLSIYAESGGWTFDEQGEKSDVIYQECYSLQKSNRHDNTVKAGTILKDKCPICDCNLIDILTIDGNDERLAFLQLKGKVHIPICPNCASMCEKTIIRYAPDGNSTMEIIEAYSDENYLSEKELNKLVSNKLTLSKTQKPIFYACGIEETCTIGGHAEWIQDWQYETCPECEKKMKLLSSISWNELMDGSDGSLYIEICTDCHIIIVFHQQT